MALQELMDPLNPCLLIGDIGGTHARIALVQGPQMLKQRVYSTLDFEHLLEILNKFQLELAEDQNITGSMPYPTAQAACFAVAGPVLQGEVLLTNVGWRLNETDLREALKIEVRLVNDFYAQAVSIPHLTRTSLVHLCGPELQHEGEPRPIAVLGAGTGLGEALLIPEHFHDFVEELDENSLMRSIHYQAVATEGSHARFAPRNEQEIGLMRWLQGRYGEHISVERVVSGQGLVDLFHYLQAGRPISDEFEVPITAAQISRAALNESDNVCQLALKHFVEVYADEAANLVLKSNAEAVYLSGGITQKILPALHAYFHGIFTHKGRYQNWLSKVSVWVVMAQEPGLLGAQIIAEDLV
jgi:glucokinase